MNREEKLEYDRNWRLAHKERCAEYRKRYYQKRKPTNFCVDCGKAISPRAERCSKCFLRIHNDPPYIRTPEIRERNRQGLLRHLVNPEALATFKANIALATTAPRSHKKPNKSEILLINLLNELYPNEWRFTGNGDFWIGNLNPDFISNNGKKLAIELFGDYWHNRDGLPYHNSELGRIMYFGSYGYKTLVIWENELKDTPSVARKINHWLKKQRRY